MLDNLAGDFTKLSSIIDTTFINLGDSIENSLRPVTKIITNMVAGFNKFIQTKAGKFILKVTAALSALLIVGGGITLLIGAMKFAFFSLAPAIWAAVAPILPFVALIAAIAAGFWLMYEAVQSGSKAMAIFGTILITAVLGPIGGALVVVFGMFMKLRKSIGEFNRKTVDELGKKGGIAGFFEKLAGLAVGFKAVISSIFGSDGKMKLSIELENKLEKLGLLDTVKNFGTWVIRIKELMKGVKEVFVATWKSVRKTISSTAKWLASKFKSMGGPFKKWGLLISKNTSKLEDWKKMGKLLGKTMVFILGGIAAAFVAVGIVVAAIVAPIVLAMVAIGAAIYASYKIAKVVADGIVFAWRAVISIFNSLYRNISEGFVEAFSFILNVHEKAFDAGVSFVTNLWAGIKSMWGQFTGWLSDSWGSIVNGLGLGGVFGTEESAPEINDGSSTNDIIKPFTTPDRNDTLAQQNANRFIVPSPTVLNNNTNSEKLIQPIITLDGEQIGAHMNGRNAIENSRNSY